VIYLYAIAEELTGLPGPRRLDDAPLDRRTVDGLDLVVSEHDGTDVAASEEAVLAHARVVEALVERSGALLPARFGRGFRDEAALREAIEGRAGSLRDALAQVRGCVEVGVRVLAPEAVPSPETAESGRAYMEARLARAGETERLAGELHEPLAELARAATRTVGATPRLLLSGAYLVEPGELDAFRRRVGELEAEHPELTFVSTGPWPPYSFALGDEK
jgi:Gas vesicle synthesis protein GvpL/GvpF